MSRQYPRSAFQGLCGVTRGGQRQFATQTLRVHLLGIDVGGQGEELTRGIFLKQASQSQREPKGGVWTKGAVNLAIFGIPIDDRQITHLICVRLRHLLYDFLGVFWAFYVGKTTGRRPETPPKKSDRKCFRRTQIRWVIWRSSTLASEYLLSESLTSEFPGFGNSVSGRVPVWGFRLPSEFLFSEFPPSESLLSEFPPWNFSRIQAPLNQTPFRLPLNKVTTHVESEPSPKIPGLPPIKRHY